MLSSRLIGVTFQFICQRHFINCAFQNIHMSSISDAWKEQANFCWMILIGQLKLSNKKVETL